MQELYHTCQDLAPKLEGAVAAGDMEDVAAIAEKLGKLQQAFEAGLKAAKGLGAEKKRWMQVGYWGNW